MLICYGFSYRDRRKDINYPCDELGHVIRIAWDTRESRREVCNELKDAKGLLSGTRTPRLCYL